jgi:hypothetical protein
MAISSPCRSRSRNGSGYIQMPFVCAFEPLRKSNPEYNGTSKSSQSPFPPSAQTPKKFGSKNYFEKAEFFVKKYTIICIFPNKLDFFGLFQFFL